MGATRRTQKLGSLIRAELAELMLRRVKDPRLAGISVTAVDVSPDLSQAKVYFSLLEGGGRAEAEKAFKSAAGYLRGQLATRLNLKSMPRLIPVYDASLATGAAMSAAIREVRQADEDNIRRRDSEPDAGQEPGS